MYFEIPGTNVRVLGSLHMVPAGAGPMPESVKSAYDWCAVVIHEHDNAQVLPCMQGNTPLQTLLRPATWSALATALPSDEARAAFDALRPWAALIALGAGAVTSQPGVEAAVLARAAVDGKALQTLETADDLRRAFDCAPLAVVEDALDQVLLDLPLLQQRFEALHAAWLTGDRAAVLEVGSQAVMFKIPALHEAGLVSRNRAWATKVRQLMALPHRTLVVVGALHLCGPGNLEECLGVQFRPA
jgi:uncharacterized protein YbaP (TraB family)